MPQAVERTSKTGSRHSDSSKQPWPFQGMKTHFSLCPCALSRSDPPGGLYQMHTRRPAQQGTSRPPTAWLPSCLALRCDASTPEQLPFETRPCPTRQIPTNRTPLPPHLDPPHYLYVCLGMVLQKIAASRDPLRTSKPPPSALPPCQRRCWATLLPAYGPGPRRRSKQGEKHSELCERLRWWSQSLGGYKRRCPGQQPPVLENSLHFGSAAPRV
mmetsp:Transcript_100588/g.181582  ORF Transcript_100588/g.181582 Transcript_100588/m.181582 type:complete len:214 (+) Transcript_100588:1586-2227(+)